MPYAPLALANSFIEQYGSERGIEHMKLQKLAYYAYGWWLAYEENPLLSEGPEVWKYGPVFSSLYNVLCPFGSKPIRELQRDFPLGPPPKVNPEDGVTLGLISWIWNRYGHETSFQLSDSTHRPGTPWQVEAAAWKYRVPKHHRIPDGLIKGYFKKEADKLVAA